jgi:hypothetical protein
MKVTRGYVWQGEDGHQVINLKAYCIFKIEEHKESKLPSWCIPHQLQRAISYLKKTMK